MMQVIQFHTDARRPYWAYVWFYDNFCHSPCKHYCIRVYGLSEANSAVIPDHILWFIPFLTLLHRWGDGCLSFKTSSISRFLNDILNPGQKWNKRAGERERGRDWETASENKEDWSAETKCKIEVKSGNEREADGERDESEREEMERKRASETHFIMFRERVTFRFLHTFVRPQLLFSHQATKREKGLKECWRSGGTIPHPQAVRLMINEVSLSLHYGWSHQLS